MPFVGRRERAQRPSWRASVFLFARLVQVAVEIERRDASSSGVNAFPDDADRPDAWTIPGIRRGAYRNSGVTICSFELRTSLAALSPIGVRTRQGDRRRRNMAIQIPLMLNTAHWGTSLGIVGRADTALFRARGNKPARKEPFPDQRFVGASVVEARSRRLPGLGSGRRAMKKPHS